MSPPELTEPLTGANPQQTLTKSADHSIVKARHNRPTAISNMDWSHDHNKTYRLLDWVNSNQLTRDVIFAVPKKGPQFDALKSRRDCYIEAAHYIFTVEEDPVIHREISKDATRVATCVQGRLSHLKKKYQAFNVQLGPEASILKYENIEPGSDAHRKIESLSQSFPFWKELHKHWRTLPHYNEFWDGGPRAKLVRHIPEDPPQKGNSGRSRAPSKKLLLSNEGGNRHPTGSNFRETRENNSEVIIIDELPTKEEDECFPQESARGRKRVHAEFEEGSSSGHQGTGTNGLTSAQKFEQNLAELALKRQKLENEALEKKTAADIRRLELEAEERRRIAEDNRQREKERYELIMKYMAVTGTGAKGNDGEHA